MSFSEYGMVIFNDQPIAEQGLLLQQLRKLHSANLLIPIVPALVFKGQSMAVPVAWNVGFVILSQEGGEARELPCAHLFHCTCVEKWQYINWICPFCKPDISKCGRQRW